MSTLTRDEVEETAFSEIAASLMDVLMLAGQASSDTSDEGLRRRHCADKQLYATLLHDMSGIAWRHALPQIEQAAGLCKREPAEQDVRRARERLEERLRRAVDDDRLDAHLRNFLQVALSRLDS